MTPSPRGFQGLKTLGFVAKAPLVSEVKVDSTLLQGAPLSITLGSLKLVGVLPDAVHLGHLVSAPAFQ